MSILSCSALYDNIARRIHFRQGNIMGQLTLLLLVTVSLMIFFVTHQLLETNKHVANDNFVIAKTSDAIRTHFFEYRENVAALNAFGELPIEAQAAKENADAIFAAINSELDWYAEHPDIGVDYPAQLQDIATMFLQLQQLEQQMSMVVSSGGNREEFMAFSKQLFTIEQNMDQSMIGLAQQQLFGIQQQFEESASEEDWLLSVGTLLIVVFGIVASLLLRLMQHAVYLHAKSSVDVINHWANNGFQPRITDFDLLEKVPSDDHSATFSQHYPFSMLAHNINHLGDVMQIFLLESHASLEAMAAGNTERRINHDGFPWQLKNVAIDINANIDRVVDIYMKADRDEASLNNFQRDLSIISQSLGAVADSMGMHGMELTDATQLMDARVKSTEQEGSHVQQSMGQAAEAVDAISQSISEVAGQVREASAITNEAVEQAQETRTTIAHLEQASGKIGNMVELITTIARQTQMLSMNATIEAARAGDAGRGFAVVANEVKDLATQTSGAAQDISASIAEIQQTTEAAMQVIQRVAETIERINTITIDLEHNAAQQEHAAKGIASNVMEANRATTVMGENLTTVRTATDSSNRNVETMNSATQELRQSIDELDGVVTNYIGEAEPDDIELF
ncbi:MAG: methyl-accepting chemotaxis protein [Mariprofundales bacterium]